MGAVVLLMESDPSDPFVDEPGILSSADMVGMIIPAREGVVIERASSAFEPSEYTATGQLEEFELNGPARFLLDYDGSGRTRPPLTRSPILILTMSHPRSLLSIARSNIARSRSRRSRSSQNRWPRPVGPSTLVLAPCFLPAFQGRRSLAAVIIF